MKFSHTCLLAIAAVTLIGACDSHPWSQTQALHEKHQDHAEKSEAGEKPAADEHAAKKE